jgi:hypothetical protein
MAKTDGGGDDGGLFDSVLGGGSGTPDWDPAQLHGLGVADLEKTVVALYEAEGYEVERAGPTAEDGVDFIARDSRLLRSSKRILCVRSGDRSVSRAIVDLLDRSREINGAETAVLIRPDGFPEPVREAAAGRAVTLLDGELLAERLNRSGLDPSGE